MPRVVTSRSSTVQAAGAGCVKKGLTCTNCRRRKTRCDGHQPGCRTCEVHNDECQYDHTPPMSQIREMAMRLQEAERIIQELQGKLRENGAGNTSGYMVGLAELSGSEGNLRPLESLLSAAGPEISSMSEEEPEKAMMSDISRDDHGELCYHGPTSAVHDPLVASPPGSLNLPAPSQLDIKAMLKTNALELRDWEEFALNSAAAPNDIPRNVISKLLQVYWTWLAPMFMWTYRYPFIRDMSTGGTYFSQFLLTVMCAHSARFYNTTIADILIVRVRQLLGEEILKPSAIPTVQGLLMLSARDLAYGQVSQAWLYSGMAFRMVSDLGLHHNTSRIATLGTFKPEDLEIRKRLFWSCYLWDKAISLYLGRMPVLTAEPAEDGPDLLDDVEEDEVWVPYNVDGATFCHIPVAAYPTYKASANSCFQNNCKLAVILNDILLQLYSKRVKRSRELALPNISRRLEAWRRNSPAHLVFQTPNLPRVCPPPHIISQNLLYQAAVILLHRPFWSDCTHRQRCRQAGDEIEALLKLLESTFAFSRIHYLMAYCLYTGASVMLQDLKNGDSTALPKVQTFLRALRGAVLSCPVVQRSVDIITASLNQGMDAQQAGSMDTSVRPQQFSAGTVSRSVADQLTLPYLRPMGNTSPNPLDNPGNAAIPTMDQSLAELFRFADVPAFPHRDPLLDTQIDSSQSSAGYDPFSFLDSFPETQSIGMGSGWPTS